VRQYRNSALVSAEGPNKDLIETSIGELCHADRPASLRRSDPDLTVLNIMPPGKYFGEMGATSIDLDTRDLVWFSRYRSSTRVVTDSVKLPFDNIDVCFSPDHGWNRKGALVDAVANMARRLRPHVIVVQQRLPLASHIAKAVPDSRVVLRTHTFPKTFQDRRAPAKAIRRAWRARLYQRLGGIVHVSEACADALRVGWPQVNLPSCIVGNGLDFREWSPVGQRSREVLLVSRCTPEKGVLEGAKATVRVLKDFPEWKARFILAETSACPAYWAEVRNVLTELGNQVSIEFDQPHKNVRRAYERAAIALVPSKWIEPFGRTALEAHAGGAALITSGTGGLSEISGDTALRLPEVSCATIERALMTLLTDESMRVHLAREGAERVRSLFDIRIQAERLDRFLATIARR